MNLSNAQNRTEHIYGRKYGLALTLEVFQPSQNKIGSAIILILSEGWFSNPEMVEPLLETIVAPLLSRGHTVFAVAHSSNPKFTMRDAINDIHRAVRYIRYNSHQLKIDPERIGAIGWSAGGQLAISLASQDRKGFGNEDPIDLQSSHIAACCIYFSVTDFMNWGENGNHMTGNHPSFPLHGAFAFSSLNEEKQCFELIIDKEKHLSIAKSLSPIEWVKKDQAPTCIITGDKDVVVPPKQSERLAQKLLSIGAVFKHIIIPGGTHDMDTVASNISMAISWFDKYL